MTERESPYLWSTTATSNGSADPGIAWPELMLPSLVNDSARAMMAAIARWIKDAFGDLTTGGSANAYTLTIKGTQTAYATGQLYGFKASFSNTGAATLNITNADADVLGAKSIKVIGASGEAALSANMIRSGGHYMLRYDAAANSSAGAFILLNPSHQPIIAGSDGTAFPSLNNVHLEIVDAASENKTGGQVWFSNVTGTPRAIIGAVERDASPTLTYDIGIATTPSSGGLPLAFAWFDNKQQVVSSNLDPQDWPFDWGGTANFVGMNTKGGPNLIGYSTNSVSDPFIPIALYGVGETSVAGVGGAGLYAEARASAASIVWNEISTQNCTGFDPLIIDPNHVYGIPGDPSSPATAGVLLQPGGSKIVATPKDCSAAISITFDSITNVRWLRGLVFNKDAILASGGHTEAINLAINHEICWYDATGANVGRLTSVDGVGLYFNSLRVLDSGNTVTVFNKTFDGSNTISIFDANFTLQDEGDVTRRLKFQLSGITTGTTRTLTVQDASGTLALTSNKLSAFASTTSAELAGVISDETGSGALVFANTPTLVTPVLGVATATSVNKVAITSPATSATLTIADGKTATHNASTTFAGTDGKTLTISNSGTLSGGDAWVLSIAASKTLTVSNTLTFTGTDSSSVAFGAGGTVAYTGNKLSVFAATSSSELAGVISDETGSGALVFANTPTLVTPVLGVATATSINKVALTAPATSATLTIADGKTATHNASTTFAGTDGKTLTISNSGTLAGGDAFTLAIAASKTLTVSNSITFTATDGSTLAIGAGGTLAGAAYQTYAEGTWTPAVTTDGTAGTPSYTIQVGSYERVGRLVTARFVVQLSGWTGSPTGNVSISGLPLTSTSTTNDRGGGAITNFVTSSNFATIKADILPSSTSVRLVTVAAGGANTTAQLTAAQFGTTGFISGVCQYRV